LPLGTVIATGLALAIGAFMATRAYYADLEQQQFRRSATYYETRFKDDVARHVTSLAAIRAFVSATRGVTRWEFSAYANQILPLNAGFRAVLWVPKVVKAARPAYEASLQRDGLYGLRIHELTEQGLVVAAQDRSSYLPISYVEPFEGNDSLVGLDLSAVPSFSQLFRTAEQTGMSRLPHPSRAPSFQARGVPPFCWSSPWVPRLEGPRRARRRRGLRLAYCSFSPSLTKHSGPSPFRCRPHLPPCSRHPQHRWCSPRISRQRCGSATRS
jgi:hypothetical protein